jgi:hypothetical protein
MVISQKQSKKQICSYSLTSDIHGEMSNARLLTNKFISVEHLNPDSPSANTEGFVQDASLQAVPVNIQSSSKEVIALFGGAFGKSYTVFTTSSGILETDRITVVSGTDNRQFIIKGKEMFDLQLGQHQELYVEEVL